VLGGNKKAPCLKCYKCYILLMNWTSLSSSGAGIPVATTSIVDWTEGRTFYAGWIAFQVLLLPTFLTNLGTFLLISTSDKLRTSGPSKIIRLLTLQDAVWSLFCLIQCTLNLANMQMYGELVGCKIQTFYGIFFILSTSCSLCLIAYSSDSRLRSYNIIEDSSYLWLVQGAFWIGSACVAAACIDWWDVQPSLVPSGLFCFLNLLDIPVGLTFYGPVALILGFLTHRYLRIYAFIRQSTREFTFANIQEEAYKRQVRVARRMFMFVLAFVVCATPTVALCLYEQITRTLTYPAAHLFAGQFAHLSSLLNPILYVWLHSSVQQVVSEKLSKYLCCSSSSLCSCCCGCLKRNGNGNNAAVRRTSTQLQTRIVSRNSGTQTQAGEEKAKTPNHHRIKIRNPSIGSAQDMRTMQQAQQPQQQLPRTPVHFTATTQIVQVTAKSLNNNTTTSALPQQPASTAQELGNLNQSALPQQIARKNSQRFTFGFHRTASRESGKILPLTNLHQYGSSTIVIERPPVFVGVAPPNYDSVHADYFNTEQSTYQRTAVDTNETMPLILPNTPVLNDECVS
jgi:hypothetical protein